MNHLSAIGQLNNRYFAMRHGYSLANQQKIIVSAPENGICGYGLSRYGKVQVENAINADTQLDSNTKIVSSDFKRGLETANLVHRVLQCHFPVRFDQRLRERHFGELELSSDVGYGKVWEEDVKNERSSFRGVEFPDLVMDRITAFIIELEAMFSEEKVLLVSHGDVLQILQAGFANQPAHRHRDQPHLETAEIRALTLNSPNTH